MNYVSSRSGAHLGYGDAESGGGRSEGDVNTKGKVRVRKVRCWAGIGL